MAITLVRLCEDVKQKYNMQLIAGRKGMENIVRWVHMVEDSEVPDFLHGEELIFTTGIGHIGNSAKMLEFVKNLYNHGASGITFNIGPYIHSIPKEVIDFCDQKKFPLFTLPWEIHIIDITYDFCNRIIENEKSEMSIVQAFKNLIFNPERQDDYLSALEKNGFLATSDYRVITICFFKDGKSVTSAFYNKNHIFLWKLLAHSSHASAVIEQDSKLLIIRQNCSDMQVKRMVGSIKKAFDTSDINYYIGVSETGYGFESVPSLYRQSNAAYITSRCENKSVMFYKDLGLNGLILAVNNKQLLEKFSQRTLEPILSFDDKNNTDYTELLRLYLENECSVMAVAEKTGVHRNTINNRLKQIRELLGDSLSEKKKAELMLAFQIKDLIKFI